MFGLFFSYLINNSLTSVEWPAKNGASFNELLGYSKFGRKNYRKNKEKFHRLLEDSEDYPIDKDNAYDILIQFIHKAKMISGICEEREVRYFIGEKIKNDDMEEEESMEEMNVGH